MIKIETVLVGTDAEVPLQLLDGTLIPVLGLVGGTKEKPRALGKLGAGFAVQEDNVNLEFNIPPAKDAQQFYDYIQKAQRAIGNLLPPMIMPAWQMSSMRYKPEFLKFPQLKQFGCTPDYCVYSMEENPRPQAEDETFRTASAHIHVGWEDPTNEDRRALVKMLDLTLSLAFVGMEDAARKKLYGRAGAMRPKEYGVEYRSLSNRWLPNYAKQVFRGVQRAVELVNEGVRLTQQEEQMVIDAINSGERSDAAFYLADKHGVHVVA